MIRNDYRRALIMLRALEKGYSGHVRLERRTLRGNMQFSITAPSGGELHAAILARKPGTYAAEDLGGIFSATAWMNARSSLSHSLLRQKCALFSRAI